MQKKKAANPTFEPVYGNVYDKYGSKNFLVKKMMAGYFRAIEAILSEIEFANILDYGCGEGYITNKIKEMTGKDIIGIEYSEEVTKKARDAYKEIPFYTGSIYEIPFSENSFDLVCAFEVLEHLEDPKSALGELSRVAGKYVLVGVPWEPVWRLLNLVRLKYVKRLGNTPGHIQHFTRSGIERLAGDLKIAKTATPFPWTLLLLEKTQEAEKTINET